MLMDVSGVPVVAGLLPVVACRGALSVVGGCGAWLELERFVRGFACGCGFGDVVVGRALCCLKEALVNGVWHGHGGSGLVPVVCAVGDAGGSLVASVCDGGGVVSGLLGGVCDKVLSTLFGVRVLGLALPVPPPADRLSGRGLLVMGSVADRVGVAVDGPGCRVCFQFVP